VITAIIQVLEARMSLALMTRPFADWNRVRVGLAASPSRSDRGGGRPGILRVRWRLRLIQYTRVKFTIEFSDGLFG